ncbi:MAG: GFA family protein [Steroidobacteraceae bacterium]
MIESSCHCGAVKLEILDAPEEVTDCNCSICRRYGALWAYYSPAHVRIIATKGATDHYLWGDKSIEFHRCPDCGCVTHWAAVDQPSDRMGVNARLMEPEILAAARLRRLDGANTWKYVDD